jgi:hypothetical protein
LDDGRKAKRTRRLACIAHGKSTGLGVLVLLQQYFS